MEKNICLLLKKEFTRFPIFGRKPNNNYAFWAMHPEIDWNAEYMRFLPLVIEAKSDLEYYLLLMRFYALLRDGHTSVIPPPALFEGKSVPFAVICAEGKFLLSAVDKDQSELLLSEITHIQGQPINEYIKKRISLLLARVARKPVCLQ